MIQFFIMRIPNYVTGAFVILLTTAVITFLGEARRDTISPLPEGSYRKILGIFSVKKDPDVLKDKVTGAIAGKWKNYSVVVADLNSGFEMGINEHEIFTAASINKLFILAALYDQAQNGSIDFDRIITLQAEDIQDYGTGSIRYDPPGSTYSVKTLVRLMMQKSDNTAAFLLANYVVGLDTIQSKVNGWGMTQTDMVNNKTSNADAARLMEKIYRGNVTNPAYTTEMLGFMRDSDFEDRLPAKLPKDVTVYHKIGSGDTGEVHDVGIVVYGKTKYYVGVLTTGAGDPEAAAKLLADVSRVIYDFMR
jgi:beta-lactamase class A